jgi:hypothetical protein
MDQNLKSQFESVIDNFSIIDDTCKDSAKAIKRTCDAHKYDKQKLQSIAPNLYVWRAYSSLKNEVATMRQIDDLIKNYFE